jgi:DnaJ-class molecular chaperone
MTHTVMVACGRCRGIGAIDDVACCPSCGGIGRVAQRRKPVLTSTVHGQTFFRGALVSQNYRHKGTKR